MRKILTAVTALILAGTMAAGMASCGDKDKKESSTSENMLVGGQKPTDMSNDDYQKAYVSGFDLKPSDDENISVMISFDSDYFGGESKDYSEIYLVDKYIDALNKNDVAAVKECYYPDYLESLCENGDYETPEAFIKAYYSTLEQTLCQDFSIDFIDVSNCQVGGDLAADTMFATRDQSLQKAFGDDFTSKITERKLLTIAGYTYFTSKSGDGYANLVDVLPEGIQFCVYTIDGKPYIF